MSSIWWIVLSCAVATYLIRFLPLYRAMHRAPSGQLSVWQRFLMALGPSAICVLLVISLMPFVHHQPMIRSSLKVLIALVVIIVVKRWQKGVAVPTFCGVGIYALLTYSLG